MLLAVALVWVAGLRALETVNRAGPVVALGQMSDLLAVPVFRVKGSQVVTAPPLTQAVAAEVLTRSGAILQRGPRAVPEGQALAVQLLTYQLHFPVAEVREPTVEPQGPVAPVAEVREQPTTRQVARVA